MRVCVVGTGSIGRRHIANIHSICFERNIPLEIDVMRATKTPLDSRIASMVSSTLYGWEEVDERYSAVIVANPTSMHLDTLGYARDFADYFFVEKPLSADIRGCEDRLKILSEEGTYYVACPLRYTQVMQEASKIVQENRVFSARAISSSYLPAWRTGVDYRCVYSAHKDQGGGVSIDLIHEWDYLIQLFGFPESLVMHSSRYSDLEIDSDDVAVYIGGYLDKVVEVHLDYFGRCTQRKLELFTDSATFLVDIAESTVYRNGKKIWERAEDPNEKYLHEMRMFLDIVVEGRNDSPNSLEHAYGVQMVAQGIV